MTFIKTTEKDSNYNHLEKMSVIDILNNINNEDQTVPNAVKKVIPKIEILVNEIVEKIKNGGRLFYIGSGTSGRLGIVDASECPPTFGVPHDLVIGIIAGGDSAIRKAVEFAEDSTTQGWKDLKSFKISYISSNLCALFDARITFSIISPLLYVAFVSSWETHTIAPETTHLSVETSNSGPIFTNFGKANESIT